VTVQDRRVVVNRDVCVGSGWCVNLASGAFVVDPADGKARVVASDGAASEDIEEAVDSCPVAAISFQGNTE
jgi:ferredoxin